MAWSPLTPSGARALASSRLCHPGPMNKGHSLPKEQCWCLPGLGSGYIFELCRALLGQRPLKTRAPHFMHISDRPASLPLMACGHVHGPGHNRTNTRAHGSIGLHTLSFAQESFLAIPGCSRARQMPSPVCYRSSPIECLTF